MILVAISTFVAAMAQILMKKGADYTHIHPGLLGLVTNVPLIVGYALYGLMTVMITVAFKDGEFSILYPVISLSYVWVTALSVLFFHDTVNPFKFAGLLLIIAGVAVIGRGTKS